MATVPATGRLEYICCAEAPKTKSLGPSITWFPTLTQAPLLCVKTANTPQEQQSKTKGKST